jgi:hypothetical protein
LISIFLLNNSCYQISDFPKAYTIICSNDYFEALEYVEIGDQKIENIAVDEDRKIENISPGSYWVTVVTQSQLKIKAPVELVGLNQTVRVIIENTGKILLEEIYDYN